MQRGFILILYLMVSLLVGAQAPKKSRMQISASSKEAVYRSWEDIQAELRTKSTPAKAPTQTGKNNAAENKTVSKVPKEKKTAIPTKLCITLKANVPSLAVGIQDLAIEIKLYKYTSIDFPVMQSIGDIEREYGLYTITFQPKERQWLKSAGEGHFSDLHAHAAWFNLKWEDMRYQSEQCPLLGTGISYDYELSFSEHWGAEFMLGAGYVNMKYNTYYSIENGARLDTRKRNYWGITYIGTSLVYRF